MFSAFERMVALRYLRARRREGFISVIAGFSLLGIMLGVATLIIVMSVMNGFREELLSRILGVGGHITIAAAAGPLKNYDTVVDHVRHVSGVKSASPLIEGQVMATFRGNASGAVVRGVRPSDLAKENLIAKNIKEGNFADFGGPDTVLIGSRLAQQYGIFIGDSISLISPKGNITAFGMIPRTRAFKVVGIFEIGMYEYDSHFIYMPLEAAQSFFQLNNAVSAVEIRLDNPDAAPGMRATIAKAAGVPVRVGDWQQANSSFFTAIQVERNVMFLILTLIIVVAAFNVISGLIMLVKDKGRDIAILRTMGATRGMIMRIFLLAGASVGFVGTLMGFALGLVFCENIESIRQLIQKLTGTNLFSPEVYFLSQLPAKVDPHEVATVVLMSLGLSLLATLYPSWRAARLDPVEALRYE